MSYTSQSHKMAIFYDSLDKLQNVFIIFDCSQI